MAAKIFTNPEERRLRAGWRILIQLLIFLAITLVFSILTGIGAAIAGAAAGQDLTDPTVVAALSTGPLARVFTAVGSLIAIFVSYAVAVRWLDRRPLRDFGFHFSPRWWADLVFGLVLGALLMAFIFAAELAAGWITITGTMQSLRSGTSFWTGILSWIIVFLCVGIYEEMLSRGYQLRNLAEGLNFKSLSPKTALLLAYLISSSIFGALHATNPNASLVSTLMLILAGLFLGLGYILTGELAISIGLHITWNFFQGNVFGFPVSGTSSPATFIAIEQGGPTLWTGGAFGPEAGLIGMAAILLGSLLTVLWVKWRHGQVDLKEELAVYRPGKALTAAGLEEGLPPAGSPAQQVGRE